MRLQHQVRLYPSRRARVPSPGDEECSVALASANIKFNEDLTVQTMILLTDGVSQESEDCGTAGLAIDICGIQSAKNIAGYPRCYRAWTSEGSS